MNGHYFELEENQLIEYEYWGELRRKAMQGNPEAQLEVFEKTLFSNEGKLMLCRAADSGYTKAQKRLADIYFYGWFIGNYCFWS